MSTDYTRLRNFLLILYGQAAAFASVDPLCPDSVEMLEAVKESGTIMQAEILNVLQTMPKEQI